MAPFKWSIVLCSWDSRTIDDACVTEEDCVNMLSGVGLTGLYDSYYLAHQLRTIELTELKTQIGFADMGDATLAVAGQILRRQKAPIVRLTSFLFTADLARIARLLEANPVAGLETRAMNLDQCRTMERVMLRTPEVKVYLTMEEHEEAKWAKEVAGNPDSRIKNLEVKSYWEATWSRLFWEIQERGTWLGRISVQTPHQDTLTSDEYMFRHLIGTKRALLALRGRGARVCNMPREMLELVGRMLVGYTNKKL